MLSSLIYGPASLEAYKGEKGQTLIRQKTPLGNLEIGSGQKTLYPDFIKQIETDMIIGDIAGFEDTMKEYNQLLNILVNKIVFNYAVFLKFIVPITLPQITEARGGDIIKLMKTVQSMFKTDLGQAIKSVFPVLLRVQPQNVSAMHEDFDIDDVKGKLFELLNHDVEN